MFERVTDRVTGPLSGMSRLISGSGGIPRSVRFVGGKQTTDVVAFESKDLSAAVYTDKGIGYENYNEDGVAVGHNFIVVVDQAGGHAKLPKTGQASAIAAKWFERAAASIHQGADPESTLREAIRRAHEEIAALNARYAPDSEHGAGTTLTGAVLHEGTWYLVNVGDAETSLYRSSGGQPIRTRSDALAEQLWHRGEGNTVAAKAAVGAFASDPGQLIGVGVEPPEVRITPVEAKAGDRVLAISDGIRDVNLAAQGHAKDGTHAWKIPHWVSTWKRLDAYMRGAASPTSAVRDIIDFDTRKIEAGDAKRDNRTAGVLFYKGGQENALAAQIHRADQYDLAAAQASPAPVGSVSPRPATPHGPAAAISRFDGAIVSRGGSHWLVAKVNPYFDRAVLLSLSRNETMDVSARELGQPPWRTVKEKAENPDHIAATVLSQRGQLRYDGHFATLKEQVAGSLPDVSLFPEHSRPQARSGRDRFFSSTARAEDTLARAERLLEQTSTQTPAQALRTCQEVGRLLDSVPKGAPIFDARGNNRAQRQANLDWYRRYMLGVVDNMVRALSPGGGYH
jgi:serine/threonine protein phosphatase PrpC